MAIGSSNEVMVLIDFVKDLGYIDEEMHKRAYMEYEEISKMLNKYISRVVEGMK